MLRLWDRSLGIPYNMGKHAPKGHISLPSSTGMGMPLWAMRVDEHGVFKASGCPPALAPEMMIKRCSGVSLKVTGTTSRAGAILTPLLHQ